MLLPSLANQKKGAQRAAGREERVGILQVRCCFIGNSYAPIKEIMRLMINKIGVNLRELFWLFPNLWRNEHLVLRSYGSNTVKTFKKQNKTKQITLFWTPQKVSSQQSSICT